MGADRPRVMTSAVAHVTQRPETDNPQRLLEATFHSRRPQSTQQCSLPWDCCYCSRRRFTKFDFCSQLPRILFAAFDGRRMDLERDGFPTTKIHGFWNRMRTPRPETCFKALSPPEPALGPRLCCLVSTEISQPATNQTQPLPRGSRLV